MGLSYVRLLSLAAVLGAIVFATHKIQKDIRPEGPKIPVPALKPETNIQSFSLNVSSPIIAGSNGRLSLDQYLTEDEINSELYVDTPSSMDWNEPPSGSVYENPAARTDEWALVNTTPSIPLDNLEINTAEGLDLNALPDFGENGFVDRVVDIAEASPLQPESRGCGPLNHSVKSAPKHSKVRSVGMERQLTYRTSIGVEYVYKDGCYKKAIRPLNALNMPGDDGVNLRVNMKF